MSAQSRYSCSFRLTAANNRCLWAHLDGRNALLAEAEVAHASSVVAASAVDGVLLPPEGALLWPGVGRLSKVHLRCLPHTPVPVQGRVAVVESPSTALLEASRLVGVEVRDLRRAHVPLLPVYLLLLLKQSLLDELLLSHL